MAFVEIVTKSRPNRLIKQGCLVRLKGSLNTPTFIVNTVSPIIDGRCFIALVNLLSGNLTVNESIQDYELLRDGEMAILSNLE